MTSAFACGVFVALLFVSMLPAETARAAAPPCRQRDPSFAYDTETASFSVALDLRGCSWLRKKQRLLLQGTLERDNGLGSGGTAVVASCPRRSVCRITLSLEHLVVEAARYRAEITYVWNKKHVVLSASKACVSAGATANCADVP
ncbi:MAG TPA: hypothetical protein VM784_08640 [Actinomycetota bacterium]|nr:hypothetical protein [Actinomycetota bacterium]